MSEEDADRQGVGGEADPGSGDPRDELSAWFGAPEGPAFAGVTDGDRDHDLDELFARLDHGAPARETDRGGESAPDADAPAAMEPELVAGIRFDPDSDPVPDSEPASVEMAEPGAAEPDPVAWIRPEPEPQAEPEPGPEPEPEPQAEPEPGPEPTLVPETEPEPGLESTLVPETEAELRAPEPEESEALVGERDPTAWIRTGPGAAEEPAAPAADVVPAAMSENAPPAGPGGGLTRPRLIAMGVGIAVTLVGAGWALAAPGASAPVPTPSPSATVDAARVAAAIDGIDRLAAQVQTAKTSAAGFAAPLAAMQGASDETARAAAEAARQTYDRAIAAVAVPAKPSPTADTATLTAVEKNTSDARDALTAAGIAFHTAITTFIGTMPGYAVTAVAANSDGARDLRDAATKAAVLMASSDPFTPPGFAPWDGWRAALAALVADATGTTSQQPPAESSPPPSTAPSSPPVAPPVVTPPEPSPEPSPSSPPPSTP